MILGMNTLHFRYLFYLGGLWLLDFIKIAQMEPFDIVTLAIAFAVWDALDHVDPTEDSHKETENSR